MDIIDRIFSNWTSALIFFIFVLGVLYAIAKFKRVNALAKICFALMFLIIYDEFLVPWLLDFICGDKLMMDLSLLLGIREYYFGDPTLGMIFFLNSQTYPLVDMREFLDLVFYLTSMFLTAAILLKSVNSFSKRDPPPDPKREAR